MDTPVVVTVGTEALTKTNLSVLLLISMQVSFYLTVNTLGHTICVFQTVFNDD